jgi:hypothetical protein
MGTNQTTSPDFIDGDKSQLVPQTNKLKPKPRRGRRNFASRGHETESHVSKPRWDGKEIRSRCNSDVE